MTGIFTKILKFLSGPQYSLAADSYPFERNLMMQTPAGFKVTCELRGRIDVNDRDQFRANAMLDGHKLDKLVEKYIAERLEPYFNVSNHFWSFGWKIAIGYREPQLNLYRVDTSEPPTRIASDNGCVMFVDRIGRQPPFIENGCQVTFSRITGSIQDAQFIEENYSMINRELLEEIEHGELYNSYMEAVAIAALKRRADIAKEMQHLQTEQVYGENAHVFKIKTRLVDGALQVTWELKGLYGKHGHYHIKGFRKHGAGFPESNQSERNGSIKYAGEQIIDSIENGTVIQKLEEGKEYSFGFFIEGEGTWGGLSGICVIDKILFLVRIPTTAETKISEERFARLTKHKEAPTAERRERESLQRELDEINLTIESKLDKTSAIDEIERSRIEFIRKQGYDPQRERREIKAVKTACEEARLRFL